VLRKKAGTLSHEVGDAGALAAGAFVKIGSSADAAVIDAAPARSIAAGNAANKLSFLILACQDVQLPPKNTELQILAPSGQNARSVNAGFPIPNLSKSSNVDLCQLRDRNKRVSSPRDTERTKITLCARLPRAKKLPTALKRMLPAGPLADLIEAASRAANEARILLIGG
jgi:hypothetical protein